MREVLQAYQDRRSVEVLKIQNAARNSTAWFEHVERYTHMQIEQFTYSLLTRSQRISHENLRLRDRDWLQSYEAWLSGGRVMPPMLMPFKLRELTLKNRVVVSPMATYSAQDGVVGDFRHFGLEESTDEIWMTAREHDLGAARGVVHGHDVGADAVADGVVFRLHALAVRHGGFEFPEVYHDILPLETTHHAADNLARTVAELVIDHLFFRLADALHDRLTCRLRADATEILGRHIHPDFLADLHVSLHGLCF